ncbi:acetyl-CoA carboxylase biotin carboxyl carrier protein subunit [Selenihalanaerobacter shriftii]|uniref:Biotin-requiring enzyme n=1 Tax=Selenihalanaerobacter shriftii TaxID=142842 RepID=A0A1T4K1W3_9FIRM|nr:acetyl-CoA carboxylase biotin carboxyl carrier protein subunit [Selenihalanaerobacter shriftii]SJZ36462.1 Biotin-requiring enzyme [Selenihalanaerobacter shriftii]
MKRYIVQANNKEYEVFIREAPNGSENLEQDNPQTSDKDDEVVNQVISSTDSAINEDKIPVLAPMSGEVLSIRVDEGSKVNKGQIIMTIEAMKMETEIAAPTSGIINKILVKKGVNCNQKDKLALIEEVGG